MWFAGGGFGGRFGCELGLVRFVLRFAWYKCVLLLGRFGGGFVLVVFVSS